ncbi:c-type cytochrome [Stieleria sp. JC731]|uniref:c-type cytochrome n=1 Tax=Pirellulaceae TaxID=2691357 RepID=UPI001E3E0314|nr:c-type cytochrome [Stieleria sp. JC731]MCC9602148.1 c-type cytochrome [Stieleria sp. JC731]
MSLRISPVRDSQSVAKANGFRPAKREIILLAALTVAGLVPGPLARAEEQPVVKSWTEADRLSMIVAAIDQSDSITTRSALVRGMLRGLEGRRNVAAPSGWNQLAKELSDTDDPDVRQNVAQLSQIFGDAAAIAQAIETLRDSTADPDSRRAALAALTTQQYDDLAAELEPLLEVPELQIDAIRAFSVTGSPVGPIRMRQIYSDATAEVKRAIIETMATRQDYAEQLVRWIDQKEVAKEDVPSYVARTLNEMLGKKFTDVFGDIESLGEDIAVTINRYKQIMTDEAIAKADPGRGRVVFSKTCGACHQMYGAGGKIGPDLTGSNRANLDYFLLNSVAPSADVPEGYRTQIVQTTDGRILTGVLAEEDAQRVVLKTVDQPRLVIAKDDIEARKVSDKSMMPDGQLDQLKPQQVLDLFRYMQTRSQVEANQ